MVSTEHTYRKYADTAYPNTVESTKQNIWEAEVNVDKAVIKFKVNTGAEVTVISETMWKTLNLSQPLHKPSSSLCGPDHTPLKILGEVLLSLTYKGRCCIQLVYVVKNMKNNLLGLPAVNALNLLSHVEYIDKKTVSQYPSLFNGLGTFVHEYKIQLKPNSVPFSLSTLRNIPLALRPKVQMELQHMESLGVISRVTEPTPWCAAMVVVPRASGAVRICVDMKPLNEYVL